MHNLKAPLTFQIFSGLSVVAAFGYYLVGKLYIVPRHNKKLLQKLEIMKMPVETISRKEHRRSSRSPGQPNASEATLQRLSRKKNKSPQPVKENKPRETKKTNTSVDTTMALDETQMTELPPDDTIPSLSETNHKDNLGSTKAMVLDETKKDDLNETKAMVLDETQMTELPPDDTVTSLNETKDKEDLDDTQAMVLDETQMTELPPDTTVASLSEGVAEGEEKKDKEKEVKTEDSAC